jgi:hypothetical protein
MSKYSVMRLMPQIDPEGTNERKEAKGPYFVWHVNGYNMLKPHGFCIPPFYVSKYQTATTRPH